MRAVERGAPTAPGMKAFRRFARGVRLVMHRNQHNVRWRVMSRALSGDGAPISVVDGAQVVVRDCCA
jgi:hypothetical protein